MAEIANCQSCPRLVDHLQQTRQQYPDYYCRPVPAFGDPQGSLLIVGLAPGKHGANATGIPFTGDAAGILLYQTLYAFGYSDCPQSTMQQPARLTGCRITNAVKCLPPANKPTTDEIKRCNSHLSIELDAINGPAVVLALGRIAHQAILRARGLRQAQFPFIHGQDHRIDDDLLLIDSYHCSRYNTQTGRLTEAMFEEVFGRIRSFQPKPGPHA